MDYICVVCMCCFKEFYFLRLMLAEKVAQVIDKKSE